MRNNKTDSTFEYLTKNQTEEIDLCLIIFAFLLSKKAVFSDSDYALPFGKYKEFFKKLYEKDLYKNTLFDTDEKYKKIITAFINDNDTEEYKDESYFFNVLENAVTIHTKDSKKDLEKILYPFSCFLIFTGTMYFTLNIIKAKPITLLKVLLEFCPSILIILAGLFLIQFYGKLMRVYYNEEKDPEVRCKYLTIDLDFCLKTLTSKIDSILECISSYDEIVTKKMIEKFSEMKSKGAPIDIVNGEARCSSSDSDFCRWYVNSEYFDLAVNKGDDIWITNNIKKKDGRRFNRDTIRGYLNDFSHERQSEW